jgi:aspartate carbamoyltransferase regulatory subunit
MMLLLNIKKELNYKNAINKYTKLDPTLPRVYNINCPNTECETNTDSEIKPEIIYIRYDEDNLKYLYLCSTCDTTWKTNDSVN